MTYTNKNKEAWEYDVYNFWLKHIGQPEDVAKKMIDDPEKMLRRHLKYFDDLNGLKVANICGSSGKKAIPLAILGADVTIFDISNDNKRYACEVAEKVGVEISYELGNLLNVDMSIFGESFDVVFMEGGVLHNFHDIDEFMTIMSKLLKPGGKIICSDFHPMIKVVDTLGLELPTGSYFSTEVFEGEMAHARFYPDDRRKNMPKCLYRKYTLSEIMNSVIRRGFVIKQFDEHPSWYDDKLPGEFTLIAQK